MSSVSAAPLITVILPVFNAEPYLAQTIESILAQSMTDFELLIIDDCSSDNSVVVARHYEAKDTRVTVFVNDSNRGRSYADNRGHALARGRYIAKMDADDVSLPHRLQTQLDFMEANPHISLTSSYLQSFGATNTVYEYPISPEEVRSFLLFNMPVGNPVAFFRRDLLTKFDLNYDETILDTFGEDYEWVARVAKVANIQNLPQVLLHYRTFPAAHKADVHARRTAKASIIREKLLQQAGFIFSSRELHVHNIIAHYPFVLGDISLSEAHTWLISLTTQNKYLNYAEPSALLQVLAARWFWTCYHNPERSVDNYSAYYQGGLAKFHYIPEKLKLKFWLKNKLIRFISR